MKRSELLASTTTPDGLHMTLSQHSDNYSIEINGQELMSTRAPGSEQALAELAAQELGNTVRPRVLIGGLGLGFTLGAALEALPSSAAVVVVELFETIVDWNRKFAFRSATDRLADPRVQVEVIDIVDYLRTATNPFHAILLDVDNGPGAFTVSSNGWLYGRDGLACLRRTLTPGGVLAVWSAEASRDFERAMTRAGFQARSEAVRSRGRKGEHHTIFVGRSRS